MQIRLATNEDIPAISRVHVAAWQTTYQGIIDAAFLQNFSVKDREESWQRFFQESQTQTFVAEVNQQIVGFIRVSVTGDFKGELSSIYLLEAFQQQGIGKCLFLTGLQALKERQVTEVRIHVLAENQATLFYEHLGVKLVNEQQIIIGQMAVVQREYRQDI